MLSILRKAKKAQTPELLKMPAFERQLSRRELQQREVLFEKLANVPQLSRKPFQRWA
jgi:hypothetical protein